MVAFDFLCFIYLEISHLFARNVCFCPLSVLILPFKVMV
jgi:hypothetical protein